MNSKIAGIIKIGIAALLVFFLGYFRNYVFLSVNAQTSAVYYHETGPAMPDFLQFITTKDYMGLIQLKWIFTIAFSAIFFITSVVIMKFFFKERIYIGLCLVLYGFLVLVSAFLMVLGYFLHSFSYHAFNIARNIMHISQSPFTVLFLCIIAYYYKRMYAKS